MGKLFRKTLFGGFRKKDVIAYLETSAAQRKEELRQQESRLQELNAQEEALRQQLQEAVAGAEDLRGQLAQAQDHTAALRREADTAENRGAQARVRVLELEEQLGQAREETARLQEAVAQLEEQAADLSTMATQLAQLEYQCGLLETQQEEARETIREQEDALACQQAEYEKLQGSYTTLLQQRQEPQRPPMPPEPRVEELLYLRREIERMREGYDALMRQMLGCNLHREPAQADPMQHRILLESINRQMDRALECLEQLVACKECAGVQEAQPAGEQTEAAARTEAPVQDVKEELGKKRVTLEEILRLVRKD